MADEHLQSKMDPQAQEFVPTPLPSAPDTQISAPVGPPRIPILPAPPDRRKLDLSWNFLLIIQHYSGLSRGSLALKDTVRKYAAVQPLWAWITSSQGSEVGRVLLGCENAPEGLIEKMFAKEGGLLHVYERQKYTEQGKFVKLWKCNCLQYFNKISVQNHLLDDTLLEDKEPWPYIPQPQRQQPQPYVPQPQFQQPRGHQVKGLHRICIQNIRREASEGDVRHWLVSLGVEVKEVHQDPNDKGSALVEVETENIDKIIAGIKGRIWNNMEIDAFREFGLKRTNTGESIVGSETAT